MAFSDPVGTRSSGNSLIDGLLWGKEWSDGSPSSTSLAVYIAGRGGHETFDFGGDLVRANTAPQETAAWRVAFAMIEAVCNVDFVEVNSQSAADLIVAAAPTQFVGGLGIAVPPGEDRGPLGLQQGAALVNRDNYAAPGYESLQIGGYDFISFIHELGHAIGLKHPHDRGGGEFPRFPGVTSSKDDYGNFGLNQGIYTMMSYNDGFPAGPLGKQDKSVIPDYGWNTLMAIDIAALQHLYGANTSYRTGNDTYTLPTSNAAGTYFSAIWDAGGTDSIVAGGNAGATINLNVASLQIAKGGGGMVSSHNGILGGFTIAKGVTIENATGGGGRDMLTGNAANNVLEGRGGRDLLTGGGGDDTFRFGAATDSYGSAADRITDFGVGADVIDLSAIDADGQSGGDGSFEFLGTGRFSGAEGEVRYVIRDSSSVTIVLGDIDGDRSADFRLVINGDSPLNSGDFLL